eukprot:1143148-Pelagomonas_calceolata.AAC.2
MSAGETLGLMRDMATTKSSRITGSFEGSWAHMAYKLIMEIDCLRVKGSREKRNLRVTDYWPAPDPPENKTLWTINYQHHGWGTASHPPDPHRTPFLVVLEKGGHSAPWLKALYLFTIMSASLSSFLFITT